MDDTQLRVQRLEDLFENLGGVDTSEVHDNSFISPILNKVMEGTLSPVKAADLIHGQVVKVQEKQRSLEQTRYLQTAQIWAEKPGLTTAEACHGVAFDLYTTNNSFQHGTDTQQEYKQQYDDTFADKIKTRSIKAAKELFG